MSGGEPRPDYPSPLWMSDRPQCNTTCEFYMGGWCGWNDALIGNDCSPAVHALVRFARDGSDLPGWARPPGGATEGT